MGHMSESFNFKIKWKVVLAALILILITAGAIVFWLYKGDVFKNSSVKASKGTDEGNYKIEDNTADKINFLDNTLASIIVPHKYSGVINTKSSAANNANNSADNKNNNKKTNSKKYDEFFSRALFIGDSITEGISAYGILDKSNVLALKGFTVLKAEKEINDIAKRNPQSIYILFGSNDLLNGLSSEKFSSEYARFIQLIKERLPNAKIYIQSIFPVAKSVESKMPKLANTRIDQYNADLKKTAESQGVNFIDVSKLLKDETGAMKKEYTSDGIHVKYKFYGIWMDYIKANS